MTSTTIIEYIIAPIQIVQRIFCSLFHTTRQRPQNGSSVLSTIQNDPKLAKDRRLQSFYYNSRGQMLRKYRWLAGGVLSLAVNNNSTKGASSSSPPVKGIIFLVHGYNENLMHYTHLAEYFNAEGFDVYGIDHHGHGASEGTRVMIEKFDHFVEDYEGYMKHIVSCLPKEQQSLPRILFGHSMGGLLSVYLASRNPEFFHAVVLSSPALQLPYVSPLLLCLGGLVRRIFPRLPIEFLDIENISKDPLITERILRDVIISHGGVQCGSGIEIYLASKRAEELRASFRVPFLIIHGDKDKICPVEGSKRFFEETESVPGDRKKLILYPGLLHETFQEECWELILSDVMQYIFSKI